MALHYLDDSQRPRECTCMRRAVVSHVVRPLYGCPDCNGTGRLGDEGAQPEVEIWHHNGDGWWGDLEPIGWYYAAQSQKRCNYAGPYSSEAAALAAAREASSS